LSKPLLFIGYKSILQRVNFITIKIWEILDETITDSEEEEVVVEAVDFPAEIQEDQQCTEQLAVSVETAVRCPSNQPAISQSSVANASKAKERQTNQEPLAEEEIQEDLIPATKKCIPRSAVNAETIVKSLSDRQATNRFFAANALVRIKTKTVAEVLTSQTNSWK